jgi:hypothetical protein
LPFKILRILALLTLLAVVAFYAKTQKLHARSWSEPLDVIIYPINGEQPNAEIDSYIKELNASVFSPIDSFFNQQGQIYQLNTHQPVKTHLGAEISQLPPAAPLPSAGLPAILWWSLKFRYWAYQQTPSKDAKQHSIRVFVLYHQVSANLKLQHSLGLDKGLLSLVHAFADIDQDAQNNIIIAHEMLHTVGATDKYQGNGEPVFPEGYAEPNRSPLWPQNKAEIMAVRMPVTENSSRMAENLNQCVIGEQTAREINWLNVPEN